MIETWNILTEFDEYYFCFLSSKIGESMTLVIPKEVIKASGLSEYELLQEIILMLFQQEKISLGKASELLGVTQFKFQSLLSERGICVHYDVAEFQEDVRYLKSKNWL